ncbi:hypothetical protein OVA03_13190 [Asticcacaulis sp. SL142]|uniref:hypothetical protein n=1 Tax=Asticcacaulis sp. SL142 TaxID=2995155 RepID=UPI00226D1802|nr:hypothetical protein [Asticcacaulis sp. SL142]WAC47650.1 hypothetical protein OVA03_13190 [Asticcacaulis sp. SL142]
MKFLNRISRVWLVLKALSEQPAPNSDGRIPLDNTPTAAEEDTAFTTPNIYRPENWQDPEVRRKLLDNDDFQNDIDEKKRFAKFAYFIGRAWVLALLAIIWLQAVKEPPGDPWGFELDELTFKLVFGGLTTSIFGFAYLVGKYLFPSGGAKRR